MTHVCISLNGKFGFSTTTMSPQNIMFFSLSIGSFYTKCCNLSSIFCITASKRHINAVFPKGHLHCRWLSYSTNIVSTAGWWKNRQSSEGTSSKSLPIRLRCCNSLFHLILQGTGENGAFSDPCYLTVTKSRQIVVTDSDSNVVNFIDFDGRKLGSFGSYGHFDSQVKHWFSATIVVRFV